MILILIAQSVLLTTVLMALFQFFVKMILISIVAIRVL
jgi:hypothetical protein